MKRTCTWLVALGGMVSAGLAGAGTNDICQPTLIIGIYDKSLATRTGGVYDKRPSVQSELYLAFPKGLFADVWYNRPLGATIDGTDGTEVDFTLGWSGEVADLSLEGAAVYYDCAKLLDGRAGNVWAPYFKISKEMEIISPYVRWEITVPDAGSDFEGGSILSLGVRNQTALWRQVSLASDLYITHDDGMYGRKTSEILAYSGGVKLTLRNWVITAPGFLITRPLQKKDDRTTETCWSMSIDHNF